MRAGELRERQSLVWSPVTTPPRGAPVSPGPVSHALAALAFRRVGAPAGCLALDVGAAEPHARGIVLVGLSPPWAILQTFLLLPFSRWARGCF